MKFQLSSFNPKRWCCEIAALHMPANLKNSAVGTRLEKVSFFPIPKKESESEVAQLCLTLCDPVDCSLSGSSIHGIFQARVLEWIATSFSRGSSQPKNRTRVSHIAGRCFTVWATREAPNPKERQCQRMLKLPHNCTHLTCYQSNTQNSLSQASIVRELWTYSCSNWF